MRSRSYFHSFIVLIFFTLMGQFTLADVQGGSGPGGGNIIGTIKPTMDQVKDSFIKIWKSNSIFKQIETFNKVYEFYAKPGFGKELIESRFSQFKNPNFVNAIKKIYEYSQRKKWIASEFKLDFKSDQACLLANNEPRDASFSLINNQPTICLSLLLITPKVDFNHLQVKLESILFHEISHLAMTDEHEAEALQKGVEDFISPKDLTKMSREDYEKNPLWLDCVGTSPFQLVIPYDKSPKSKWNNYYYSVGKENLFHITVMRTQDGEVKSAQGKLILGKDLNGSPVISVNLINGKMNLEYKFKNEKISVNCQPLEASFYRN